MDELGFRRHALERSRAVWGHAVDDYAAWMIAAGSSPGTVRLRRHHLKHLAAQCPDPWAVTLDDLVRFVACDRWGPEARKSARASVRSFYKWALIADRIASDPARMLPAVPIPLAEPRPAPPSLVRRALADACDRDRLMVMLGVFAGLRRSEIARVHRDDLTEDLLGWSLRIRGKGGRVRVVPLGDDLAATLLARPGGWIFPGQIDGHISPGQVGRILAGLLPAGWSGHTLRHAFATSAYATERDLFAVQRLLGHSKPETTARYTAIPNGALRTAVAGVRAAFAA